MNWLLSIVRVAGASFPVAASLVQLQAEIDTDDLSRRVSRLEDPVSSLHDDVPELSRKVYRQLNSEECETLEFEDEFYETYSRPLAALESQGCLRGNHAIGKRYAAGITLEDPSYVMYLCALEEDPRKMETLVGMVDECGVRQWLDGHNIKETLGLPLPVVRAVFKIFESKGYGLCSREIGACSYLGKA